MSLMPRCVVVEEGKGGEGLLRLMCIWEDEL